MSNELLNLGTSGMQAQSKAMSIIGNNIANSSTVGFKSGESSFQEAFYTEGVKTPSGAQQTQRGQGVSMVAVGYDWGGGISEETGIETHLAIVGDGLLPVTYNGSPGFTRAGDFSLAPNPANANEYVLMRPSGAILLGGDGTNPIVFSQVPTSLEISANGTVNTMPAGIVTNNNIMIQQFGNPDALTHLGAGIYEIPASDGTLALPALSTPGSAGAGYLMQGALESSNVDLVQEFTNMIATQRAFQANSKSITTADQMLQEVLQLKR